MINPRPTSLPSRPRAGWGEIVVRLSRDNQDGITVRLPALRLPAFGSRGVEDCRLQLTTQVQNTLHSGKRAQPYLPRELSEAERERRASKQCQHHSPEICGYAPGHSVLRIVSGCSL